jgi:hypothetical protein
MTNSDFFKSHDYFKFDNLLDEETCSKMTREVYDATKKSKVYNETPQLFDNIVQSNTKHIEKNGYTRKYNAMYGESIQKHMPSIYNY